MENLNKNNGSYHIDAFSIRKENDCYLIFFPEKDQIFSINGPAALIIKFLSLGTPTPQIYKYLAKNTKMKKANVISIVDEFIQKLKSRGLVTPCDINEIPVYQLEVPTISSIEEEYEKGKQCRMFGMP